jgi:archaellin
MRLFKKISTIILTFLSIVSLSSGLINTSAGRSANSITSSTSENHSHEDEKPQTIKPLKPKIKTEKGKKVIDLESDITMTKDQQKNFDKCQDEEKTRRSKRNQNKPTSCRKSPVVVNHKITDQDYNILLDQIQEKEEVDNGTDRKKEKALEEFIDPKAI